MSRYSIQVKNVTKAFSSQSILNNINMSLFQGEIAGISGPNGSGKTTFIKMLCGLISPDTGNIHINGLNIYLNRLEVMGNLGVLLDGTRNLYWRLTGWQNFVYFAGLKGIFGDILQSEGEYLLKYFGLWTVRNQKVESFSLGMKQKLSICCTFSHDPSIILLDEPTVGLDCESQLLLVELLKMKALENKTIVVSTHDMEMLHTLCNRKIIINNGTFLDSVI